MKKMKQNRKKNNAKKMLKFFMKMKKIKPNGLIGCL